MGVKFQLGIGVKPFIRRGFVALDLCRKYDLPDADYVVIEGGVARFYEVDEGFARMWFDGQTSASVAVEVDWLAYGELEPHSSPGDARVCMNTDAISVERAKELYVRARFAELEAARATVPEDEEEDDDGR